MKIGVFDSGMGGLSVLYQALQMIPDNEFVYYADEKNVPYGEKTHEQILKYVDHIIQFMIDQGCEAIVIACNTATSVAAATMRKKYDIPILGMEPAVKKAINEDGKHRVLVIATPVTVQGEKLHNLINRVDPHNLVDLLALPQLVRFAEKQIFEAPEVEEYLRQELSKYRLEDYSAVVLGCTHFNYFKSTLRKILPDHIHFVDGNEGTINNLKRYITHNELQSVQFFFSDRPVTEEEQTKINRYFQCLMKNINIQ